MNCRIIVLNYNGRDILPECLPSLVEAARRASFPTRVAVLDNRSTDGSAAWVQAHFPEVEVTVAPENRFLVSFNDYLPSFEEEIVILMNNDIRVDAGFVDPLVQVFEKYPDAFLASPQSFSFDGSAYEGGRSRAKIRWGLFWSSARFSGYEALQDKPGYTFASGFGAFHRKAFLALGGYDDLYLPGIVEDADLGFRAWREGYRGYYVPESRVYHMGQASFKKAFGERGIATLAHRNGFLFVWKNISDVSLLLKHFLFLLPRLLLAVLRGKTELPAGFFQALGRLPEVLRRRRSPERRSRPDRDVFRLANGELKKRHYLFKSPWKRVLVRIFDGVGSALFFSWIPRKTLWESPEKILVARIDSLGDGVLSLPAIESLRQRFPKAQIDFLVSPVVETLYRALFPGATIHRFEKNWLTSDAPLRKIFSESFRLARELGKCRYDLGIDFRGDFRTIGLLAAAGIRRRWGRGGTGGGFLLERQPERPYEKHEILENLELVQANGNLAQVQFPPVGLAPSVEEKIEERLKGIRGQKKIIIHPGAGYPSKCWKMSRVIELARRVVQEGLGVPIFIGSDRERRLLDPYRNDLGAGYLDFTGETTLEELLALLVRADLFIGNDSGPSHLAGMLGRKLVMIFSGTNDFRQWAPWSDRLRILSRSVPCSPCEEKVCPLGRQVCLEEISVDEVFRAAESMLQS